jgi:predicted RNase H-like HicB family nuclease
VNLVSVESLMKKPWTRVGPTKVEDPEGTYFEIRIDELPDFFVAGLTPEEAISEFPDALRAFILSYLHRDEFPPLPEPKWQIAEVACRPLYDPQAAADRSAPEGTPELVQPRPTTEDRAAPCRQAC